MQMLNDEIGRRVVTVVEDVRFDPAAGKFRIVLLNCKTREIRTEYYYSNELNDRFTRFGVVNSTKQRK
jgi:hypothetical protein